MTAIPAGVAEAQAELDQVRIESALVQAQLASRPKPPRGTPDADFQDWREWHGRAAGAQHFKAARSQFLASWIKAQRPVAPPPTPRGPGRLLPMMVHMALLLDEMLGDDTDDLSPAALHALSEMRSWMKETQAYLQHEVSNGVVV